MKALRVWEGEERLFAGANEATRFFMGEADVQRALEKVAQLWRRTASPTRSLAAWRSTLTVTPA